MELLHAPTLKQVSQGSDPVAGMILLAVGSASSVRAEHNDRHHGWHASEHHDWHSGRHYGFHNCERWMATVAGIAVVTTTSTTAVISARTTTASTIRNGSRVCYLTGSEIAANSGDPMPAATLENLQALPRARLLLRHNTDDTVMLTQNRGEGYSSLARPAAASLDRPR